ncbi:MAG: transcriptional repressor, partial [Streptococcus lutetiensis]|nr:transcriptional repressor [Streptococcus lutetiensis]
EKCGQITDLDLPIPSFKEEVESQTGFRITREQMILHGICPNCQ